MQACRVSTRFSEDEGTGFNSQFVVDKAEVYRLFECQTLASSVKSLTELMLSKPEYLKEIDEIHAAVMLHKQASLYGAEHSQNFTGVIEQHVADTWIKQFDAETWTLHKLRGPDKKHDGLKLRTAKMTEILTFLMS